MENTISQEEYELLVERLAQSRIFFQKAMFNKDLPYEEALSGARRTISLCYTVSQ